jgi:hypothetical protein
MRPVLLLEKFSTHVELTTSKANNIMGILLDDTPKEFSKDFKSGVRCTGQCYIADVTTSGTLEVITTLGNYKYAI